MPVAQSTVSTDKAQLFRHTRSPDWGLAVLLWEREGKRGYQFSDGKVRVFKQGYYELFSPAAAPGDGTARAVRRLARVAGSSASTKTTAGHTFRDQVAYFHGAYPGGFAGTTWSSKQRGMAAKRRLKRHRQPVVNEAARLATVEDDEAFLSALASLLESTDLVSVNHVRAFRELGVSANLAAAIRSWLFETGSDAKRFKLYVRALGKAAKWPLVTAIGAVVHPQEHISVHLSTMRQQAKIFFGDFSVSPKPTYKAYLRLVELVRAVSEELGVMGESPRDLLDVRDFIWATQRPTARKAMEAAAQATDPDDGGEVAEAA